MKKFYTNIEALCGLSVAGTTSLSTATGVTVATSDNSTNLATTAFVKAQGYATTTALSGYVPITRTITINGTTLDLSADRTWTIPSSAYTSKLQHQVKAGVAINKGQAVYVTGADGTNMIVGLASNAAEATSSKTMGLLDATVATNGFANVITEGLLDGLDTSTAGSEGDPVWLGTGGNLIYGLINKPSAPAHLVFIGIVTRKNNSNGEIFVKVQNGFELNEIHDVDLKTTVPVNGHILGFDGTLWVNKTIAGWLGYTPANASGTTNYISKFTGSTTLGNSLIYDDGSGVGIGTTSPSSKLSIVGPDNASGLGVLELVTSSTNLKLGGNFDYSWIQSHNSKPLRINELGNNVILNLGGGNVGIGTSSPAQKLDVTDGDFVVRDAADVNKVTLTRFGGIELRGNGTGYRTVGTPNTDALSLATNNTSRVYITSGGNVGIGTTSPTNKLQVANGDMSITSGYSFILADTDTNWRLGRNIISPVESVYLNSNTFEFVAANASDQGWQFINDDGYPVLEIGAATGSRNVWVNAGNLFVPTGSVGIGTTSPSEKLHVVGRARITTIDNGTGDFATISGTGIITRRTAAQVLSDIGAQPSGSYLTAEADTLATVTARGATTTTAITIQGGWASTILDGDNVVLRKPNYSGGGWARTLLNFQEYDTTSLFQIGGYGSNNLMTYGYLGSAYNTPTIKWYANKNVYFSGNILIDDAADNNRYQKGSTFLNLRDPWNNLHMSTDSVGGNYIDANVHYWRPAGGASYWMTLNSTGLGIGTTSPAQKLHVVGNTTITGVTYTDVVQTYSGASIDFRHQDASVVMRVDTANARVGIGTTSPSYKLDVNGETRLGKLITTWSNSPITPSAVMYSETGYNTVIAGNGQFSTSYLALMTTGNMIYSGGNVGIGTTSPVSKLTVIGTTTSAITVQSGSATSGLQIFNNSTTDEANIINYYNGPLILGTSNVERMRIAGNGNVGIGTSSPIYKLQVAGSAYVNGGTLFLDSTQYLRWGDSNQGIVGENNNGVSIVAGGATRQSIYGAGYTYFPGLDLAISNTNSTHGAGNYLRGDNTHLVIGTSGNLYLNYGGITTLSYGTFSHSGNASVSGTLTVAGNTVWHAGNDGSGSGLDADLLDGVDSGSFLRSDVSDSFSGTLTMGAQRALIPSNYGHGVYGIYSAERYQHVWSMGAGYDLPADGVSNGNGGSLYGLAWSYNPDYGYVGSNAQSKPGLNHQLLLMMNGVTHTALGSGIWTNGLITTVNHGTSANWKAAYDWGNHASAGYQPAATAINTSNIGSQTVANVASGQTSDLSASWTAPGTSISNGFRVYRYDASAANVPAVYDNANWLLNIYSHPTGGTASYGHQISGVNNGRLYFRNVSNGGFGTWYSFWTSADFTSSNVSNWNTAYGWGNHASQSYATTSYVTTQINNLINGAPGALDTLSELASALGNDASFATTVTNSIAGKVSKSGDTMTGNLTTTGLTVGNGVATGRQPYGPLANANIVLTSSASDSSGVCGIEFTSGNNYPSDGATIYFENNAAGGGSERAKLTLRVENDQEDFIELRAGKVVINANTYSGGGQNPAVIFQHNDTQIASITSGGQIDASGGNSSQWNTAYGWGNHASAGYLTSYTETDTLATVTGRGASTSTFTSLLGGSKIVIQNGNDGGNGRGIFMWTSGDSNWGIYMSTASAGVSLAGGTAVASIDGRTSHHIRFRAYNATGNGFIWENDSEQCLMSLTTNTGNLYTRGQIYAGNNTSNLVWHAGNDGSGSGLDADLLDGNHASAFATRQDGARYTTNFNSILSSGFFNGEGQPANSPDDYGQLIVAKGIDTALQIFGGYDSNNLWFRGWGYGPEADGFYPWRKIWHDGNDGASSGLDADLLDGQHGSYYAAASALSSYLPLAGGTMTGTIYFSNDMGTALQGTIGDNDFWRIRGGNAGSNAGFLEIATSDDGTEPIYVRQYTGVFSSLTRTATLLDGSGNTSLPGSLTVGGTITENSSIRYKENVVDLESATEKVEQLRAVRYNKIGHEIEEIGLIAEEVAEVYPEVVNYNEEGQPDGVNYTRLSVILLKAVQELTERINKLESK